MPQTHYAAEGSNELEYVSYFTYKVPHQSHHPLIEQSDVVQTCGKREIRRASFHNVKALRIMDLVDTIFPSAQGWVVDTFQPARALDDNALVDLWNFDLTGQRNVTS